MGLSITIDGSLADVTAGAASSLRLTRRGVDPARPGQSVGDYTLGLELPKTARNNSLLAFSGQSDLARVFGLLTPPRVQVLADGVELMAGSLFVDRVTPDFYECTLVGENIDWANKIRAKTLRDLQFPLIRWSGLRGSNYVAPWPDQEADTVCLYNVWDEAEGGTYPCQFPLISYGNFSADPGDGTALNPLNGTVLVRDSAGVVDGALIYNTTDWQLSPYVFRGGLYLKTALRQIFREAGYNLSGSWVNDLETNDLLLPFVDSEGADVNWNWGRLGSTRSWFEEGLTSGTGTIGLPTCAPPWSTLLEPTRIKLNADGSPWFAEYLWQLPVNELRYDYGYNLAPSNTYVMPAPGSVRVTVAMRNDSSLTKRFVDLATSPTDGGYCAAYLDTYRDNQVLLCVLRNTDGDQAREFAAMTNLSDIAAFGAAPDAAAGVLAAVNLREIGTNYTCASVVCGGADRDYANVTFDFANGQLIFDEFVSFDQDPLQTGDRLVVCVYTLSSVEQVASPNTRGSFLRWPCELQIEFGELQDAGQEAYPTDLQPAFLAPDIGQSDLIAHVLRQYNLYLSTDLTTRTVLLDYAGQYVLSAGAALNWREKGDIQQGIVEPALSGDRIEFATPLEAGEIIVTPELYKLTYQPNQPATGEATELVLELAATAMRRYYVVQQPGSECDLPTLNTRDELAKKLGDLGAGNAQVKLDYLPRLVKWLGWQSTGGGTSLAVGAFDDVQALAPGGVAGDFYWPGSTTVLAPLNWVGQIGGQSNLFDAGYRPVLQRLDAGARAELQLYLTVSDVAALDPRVPVRIGAQLWQVLEVVQFDPTGQGGATRVRLLLLK